jgi:hypothetical protein
VTRRMRRVLGRPHAARRRSAHAPPEHHHLSCG